MVIEILERNRVAGEQLKSGDRVPTDGVYIYVRNVGSTQTSPKEHERVVSAKAGQTLPVIVSTGQRALWEKKRP